MSLKKIAVLFACISANAFFIAAYNLGYFEYQLNLLDAKNHTVIYGSSSEHVNHKVTNEDSSKHLICDVTYIDSSNYCALTVLLSQQGDFNFISEGVDLSNYDEMYLRLDYSGNKDDQNLRISFRNYNSNYVRNNDYASLKYNSAILDPIYGSFNKRLSFNSFGVPGWWIEEMSIPVEHSKVDFSNVSYIEIIPHTITNSGPYSISLHALELSGEHISEPTLLYISLGFWLVVMLGFMWKSNVLLKLQATTDLVTGHTNYRGLTEWANSLLENSDNHDSCCVYFIDLDDFKRINTKHGRKIGDEFLTFLSNTINDAIQRFNSNIAYRFARLSGNEMAIVVKYLSQNDATKLAQYLLSVCRTPLITTTHNLKISASIGVSLCETSSTEFEGLLNLAELAMHAAKKNGKDTFVVYDEHLAQQIIKKNELVNNINTALSSNEFHLLFMPIIRLSDNRIAKAEVLLRGGDGALKNVGPDVFIPVAEESNLIHSIDMWVLERTFQYIQAHQAWVSAQQFIFCINISGIELLTDSFVDNLTDLITQYDIDSQHIELELTETCLIEVDKTSIETMHKIKNLGIRLALDDFGTGYTAFNQLDHFPVDCLKIDRSFVSKLSEDVQEKHALIEAIMGLSQSFGLETIAEGVETHGQLKHLRNLHCDMVQGYLFSKPLALPQLIELFKENAGKCQGYE